MLQCYLPYGNVGGLQLLCCQGFEVKYYDVTLDAWNLKPSDVCNVEVNAGLYPIHESRIGRRPVVISNVSGVAP
jgi:hypothetical protein